MLEFHSVYKSFRMDNEEIHVVNNANFTIKTGEFVAIIGPSGSGKSTLLGLAAGLDRPDKGSIKIDSVEISHMDEDSLAELRSQNVGFIFQNFQLLPNLTALENVSIPLMISGTWKEKEIKEIAMDLLKSVSMDHRANHFPQQLSGGEEQRIAIARSFVNNPKILFADEPTANLDTKNGSMVMDLLKDLNEKKKSTLIVVTHDPSVARLADRILEMKDGMLSALPAKSSTPKSPAGKKATSTKKTTGSKKTRKKG